LGLLWKMHGCRDRRDRRTVEVSVSGRWWEVKGETHHVIIPWRGQLSHHSLREGVIRCLDYNSNPHINPPSSTKKDKKRTKSKNDIISPKLPFIMKTCRFPQSFPFFPGMNLN
jgi:hypothetical protein